MIFNLIHAAARGHLAYMWDSEEILTPTYSHMRLPPELSKGEDKKQKKKLQKKNGQIS